ncbi:MAG: hypothetical protein ACRD2H_07820 [Terriglobales bacterium]
MARLMAKVATAAACLLGLALAPAPLTARAVRAGRAAGQVGRDPLTSSEADQLRDTADNPAKRVKLLLDFAADRLTRFQQTRAGAAPDRQDAMYRLLREYDGIIAELDDNIDEWMSGHVTGEMSGPPKLEKPLQAMMAAEQGFIGQLTKIQSSSSAADLATYHFQLSDDLDDTRDSLQGARENLADLAKQKQEAEQAKKRKKHDH